MRHWKRFFVFCLFLNLALGSRAQVFDIVVDKNGGGNFNSIQAALNSVANSRTSRTLIFVKNGIYLEKVTLASVKTNVSLIGENPEKTIISWDDNPTKNGMSSSNTFTFWADGPGFYAENVTFRNTSGNVGQALAIKTTGDTMVFKNCRFLGFQDTYYANKRRQYNLKCYIEGGTDFIYGDGTAVFDSCTINCVKGGQYISAPADTKLITQLSTGPFLQGLLFRYCNVTADADVPANSYFLGRPWQPGSSSVYIQCKLGDQIKPLGWSVWGSTTNHLTSYFAEYKSMKPDGSLADTTQRATWSHQVSDAAAENYYNLNFFLKSGGKTWDPVRITRELAAPRNFSVSNNSLNWDAVDGAIGYVILKSDSVIGFSKTNTFTDTSYESGNNSYAVKSVSMNGALSKSSADATTGSKEIKSKKPGILVLVNGTKINFSENVSYQLFSVSGKIVETGKGVSTNLYGLKRGIYLVKTMTQQGQTEITKIAITN